VVQDGLDGFLEALDGVRAALGRAENELPAGYLRPGEIRRPVREFYDEQTAPEAFPAPQPAAGMQEPPARTDRGVDDEAAPDEPREREPAQEREAPEMPGLMRQLLDSVGQRDAGPSPTGLPASLPGSLFERLRTPAVLPTVDLAWLDSRSAPASGSAAQLALAIEATLASPSPEDAAR
jgi:hypothetical protein